MNLLGSNQTVQVTNAAATKTIGEVYFSERFIEHYTGTFSAFARVKVNDLGSTSVSFKYKKIYKKSSELGSGPIMDSSYTTISFDTSTASSVGETIDFSHDLATDTGWQQCIGLYVEIVGVGGATHDQEIELKALLTSYE